MMKIETISVNEYLDIIKKYHLDIPLWAGEYACIYYKEKEIIKVSNESDTLCIYLLPINKNGVRREYRYFPYSGPIFTKDIPLIKEKEILNIIFDYIFTKYDYAFIPLNIDFKCLAPICYNNGFVEMRHTHILDEELTLEKCSSKLRNHIKSASSKVDVKISYSYKDYSFSSSIKGSEDEISKRTSLAKDLISNNKAFTIIAYYENNPIAGLVIAYDKNYAYLLHSWQQKDIRGVIPLLILKATEYSFENLNIKYFDFEGSVIDDIDNFFSSFNANLVTYPYLIEAKNESDFINLINRSKNIKGRRKL